MNRLTRGKALVGALSIDAQDITISDDLVVGDSTGTATLTVGEGTLIKKIAVSTVSINLPSIAAGATGTVTATVTGAATGDAVVFNAASPADGLAFVGAYVSAANTVTLVYTNHSGDAVDAGALSTTILWFDLT